MRVSMTTAAIANAVAIMRMIIALSAEIVEALFPPGNPLTHKLVTNDVRGRWCCLCFFRTQRELAAGANLQRYCVTAVYLPRFCLASPSILKERSSMAVTPRSPLYEATDGEALWRAQG